MQPFLRALVLPVCFILVSACAAGDTAAPVDVNDVAEPDLPCQGGCTDGSTCRKNRCVPDFCPPAAPHGIHPGDHLTDVVVKDCDGNDVHIHELCGAPAGFFNLLAGW